MLTLAVTSPASPFSELLQRVRRGDAEATTELWRNYLPHVLRVIRGRLTSGRLRQQMDSDDLCQSVMAKFFLRVRLGQFDLESPEQLIRLLNRMAANEYLNRRKRAQAACRDVRREAHGEATDELVGTDRSLSSILQAKDLLQIVQARLSPQERIIAERRADGCKWKEIGDELKADPDVLRKNFSRSVDRLLTDLRPPEDDGGDAV